MIITQYPINAANINTAPRSDIRPGGGAAADPRIHSSATASRPKHIVVAAAGGGCLTSGRLQHCLQRPRGGARDAPLVSSAAQECCRHRQLFGSVQMPRRFQQKGRLRSSVPRVPFRSLRQPWLQHTLLRLADFMSLMMRNSRCSSPVDAARNVKGEPRAALLKPPPGASRSTTHSSWFHKLLTAQREACPSITCALY